MDQVILPTGDRLTRDDKAIVIWLAGARRVLSTSVFNGGHREDLGCLFNYCEVYGKEDERCTMRAATYEGHLRMLAEDLGLDPCATTGLSTAAKMKYAQLQSEFHEDFSVTAIATGGIDVNGSRAGDPGLWHEKSGIPYPIGPGTINILVFVDACLEEAALAPVYAHIPDLLDWNLIGPEQAALMAGDLLKRKAGSGFEETGTGQAGTGGGTGGRSDSTFLIPELKANSNLEAVEKLVDSFARFLIYEIDNPKGVSWWELSMAQP